MLLRARNAKAQLFRTTMLLTVWAASGCGPKSGKLPTYMQPELLYLNDQPCSRLYVEVDSVEGVEVPDELLDDLRTLLATHCSKPDGVEIVRDKPIPISEAEDFSMGAASVLCLDGPDPQMGSQPAYLHVFFYDTKTAFKHVVKNPHVPKFCPSAICYNVDYVRSRQDQAANFMLRHEAGHVLGLCRNTAHGDGAHCSNNRCRMSASPGWGAGFFGLLGVRIKRQLCADCSADLERGRSTQVSPELEFKGPFLIRREDGYFVASLPSRHILMPESMEDEFDWSKALANLKEVIRAADSSKCVKNPSCLHLHVWNYRGQDDPEQQMLERMAILDKATKDPCPFISGQAAVRLDRLEPEETE